MASYRLFFLNAAGKVITTDEFDAPRDTDATRMAVVLADACGDQCSGFELWQANRQVAGRIGPIFTTIVENISARMDEATRSAIRECAQRIVERGSRIARSPRLLARLLTSSGTDHLRSRGGNLAQSSSECGMGETP